MDLEKITAADLSQVDDGKLKELVTEICSKKAMLQMDVYTEKRKHQGTMKKLRKSLARIETVKSQRRLEKRSAGQGK